MKRVAIALLLFSGLISMFIFPNLSALVPIKWGLSGEVIRTAPAWLAAWLLPLTGVGIIFLLSRLSQDDGSWRAVRAQLLGLTCFLILGFHGLLMASSLGIALDPIRWIILLLGIFWLGLGNLFGKLGPNRWIGIRTPWTMNSISVWYRTHRFSAPILILAGVISIIVAIGNVLFSLAIAAIFLSLLIPVVASWWFSRSVSH